METIPPVGQRPWDVWQDPARCVELTASLGKPENVWGGKLPDWMPEFGDVLDVGCGQGIYYPVLTSKGAWYAGLDTSLSMLKLAWMRFPKGVFGYGDLLCRLLNEPNSFDLVLCNSVLIHIPLPLEIPLAELRRVARHWVLYNVFVGPREFQDGELVVRHYQDMQRFADLGEVVETSPVTIGGEPCETWQVLERKEL